MSGIIGHIMYAILGAKAAAASGEDAAACAADHQKCGFLEQKGYNCTSRNDALKKLKGMYGPHIKPKTKSRTPRATDGPCSEGPAETVGTHEVWLAHGVAVGDAFSCPCCENTETGVNIRNVFLAHPKL